MVKIDKLRACAEAECDGLQRQDRVESAFHQTNHPSRGFTWAPLREPDGDGGAVVLSLIGSFSLMFAHLAQVRYFLLRFTPRFRPIEPIALGNCRVVRQGGKVGGLRVMLEPHHNKVENRIRETV
jgi:hypothetical protein